jgi:predicted GTPase
MLTVEGRSSVVMPSLASSYAGMNGDTQMRALQQAQQLQLQQLHHRHMWIITGPAGCGKSSVAEYLAKELSLPYIEGDDVSALGKKQCYRN